MKPFLLSISILFSTVSTAKPIDLENIDVYQACSEMDSSITTTIESLNLLKFNLDRDIKNIPLDTFKEKYNLLLAKPLLERVKNNLTSSQSCKGLIVSAFIPKPEECIYEASEGEWLTNEKYICPNNNLGPLKNYSNGETYTVELIKDLDGPNKSLMSVSLSVFDDILEKSSSYD